MNIINIHNPCKYFMLHQKKKQTQTSSKNKEVNYIIRKIIKAARETVEEGMVWGDGKEAHHTLQTVTMRSKQTQSSRTMATFLQKALRYSIDGLNITKICTTCR